MGEIRGPVPPFPRQSEGPNAKWCGAPRLPRPPLQLVRHNDNGDVARGGDSASQAQNGPLMILSFLSSQLPRTEEETARKSARESAKKTFVDTTHKAPRHNSKQSGSPRQTSCTRPSPKGGGGGGIKRLPKTYRNPRICEGRTSNEAERLPSSTYTRSPATLHECHSVYIYIYVYIKTATFISACG